MLGNTGMETLPVSAEAVERLIAGVRDAKPVSGLTHNFYRYPARFSPTFARAFIAECTEPGELVLDPFVGGGTTLVEAQAMGRRATGVDLSSLAVFVSTVKTTPLPEPITAELQGWFAALMPKLNLRRTSVHFADWAAEGYYRNIECARTWRIRKLLELALGEVQRLSDRRAVEFARCALLRTGQWALDGRKMIPSADAFRNALETNYRGMLATVRALSNSTCSNSDRSRIRVIQGSAANLEHLLAAGELDKANLILTSPPYPGLHVLYHRWQILGGREAAAPYWIADKLDGSTSLYYTLGDRREVELKRYFGELETCFNAIASVAAPDTIIVQMVAFSEPDWQLSRYLSIMRQCGLEELLLPSHPDLAEDGRLWRQVPNRKWHARQKAKAPGANEVVLIHRTAQQLAYPASSRPSICSSSVRS